MRRTRTDNTQPKIVEFLRKAGCTVWLVKGTMDAVVGVPRPRPWIAIVDFKGSKYTPITPNQQKFFRDWADYPVYNLLSIDDARVLLGL